jgi:FkbM family methyltransferase
LVAIARVSPRPLHFARSYLFDGGTYPSTCPLRTPLGVVRPTVYSHHDVLTVNEIFCRGDYRVPDDCRVVVDVGSNIGLSALYFLTRNEKVRTHLFEPDPRNVGRLRQNLEPFAGRWTVEETAIGDQNGIVSFGRDWGAGRYGAVGSPHGEQLSVRCRHVNDMLRAVLQAEGRIDLLKIDTEGSENTIVSAIDQSLLGEVRGICFETRAPLNPWPELFAMSASPNLSQLTRR